MNSFEKTVEVRWADCDANRHVRHSAYYDYAADVRIRFFAGIGFDSDRLTELKLGPILFKEECSFIRELRGEDSVRTNLLRESISPDGSKWLLHHELFNQNDQKVAHITVYGAWMDLEKRRVTVPPQAMIDALLDLPPGEAYIHKKGKG